MKQISSLFILTATVICSPAVSGALSGPVFYGDPPDDHHPWAVHDRNRPQPKVVTPGTFSSQEQPGKPPSDAIVLFDGRDLSKWESGKGEPAKWVVKDGYFEVKPGSGEIRTKAKFGDCQLHIEWAEPVDVTGEGQGRGNSGIFLMGQLEIQVLDSYQNPTYADGGAGGYYGINPPMANAVRPPGQFQVYDIVFRRPIYKDGQAVDPGYVTVFANGVLVQDHTMLEGPGTHMRRTKPSPFPASGPISLQDHGNPVRFRNIWYRELPPRPAEGGTDGFLNKEAALAKRKETAAGLRQEAEQLRDPENALPQMLRLLESLVYEQDDRVLKQGHELAASYINRLKGLSADQLSAKRDEARHLRDVFNYLVRFKILPSDFAPMATLDAIIREQNWDRRR